MRLFDVLPGVLINLDQVASIRDIPLARQPDTNPPGLVALITMSSQETFYMNKDALERLMDAIHPK